MVQYYNTDDKKHLTFSAYLPIFTQFSIAYTDKMSELRDYGNGEVIRTSEVYTLSLIEQNPGITVSELAIKQRRTKGTISILVSSLEKKDYISREKRSGNNKVTHLYATLKGEKLNTLYTSRCTVDIMKVQKELLKTCSPLELNNFCKVIQQYVKILTEYEDSEDNEDSTDNI